MQQQLKNIRPISINGFLLDKETYTELCEDLQAMPHIIRAEVNFAKTGIAYDGDEVLMRLRTKSY